MVPSSLPRLSGTSGVTDTQGLSQMDNDGWRALAARIPGLNALQFSNLIHLRLQAKKLRTGGQSMVKVIHFLRAELGSLPATHQRAERTSLRAGTCSRSRVSLRKMRGGPCLGRQPSGPHALSSG